MAKWFDKWLAPEALRSDGSVWSCQAPPKTSKQPTREPSPRVRLKAVDIEQEFTKDERHFLRKRLDQMEHGTGGAWSPVRVRGGDGHVRGLRCPVPAASLVARNMAIIRSEDGDILLQLTDAGRDALRTWLATQPSNFRVRFPRLYAQLDVAGAPLGGPDSPR